MQKNNKFSYLLNNEINRGKKILLTIIIGLMILTLFIGISSSVSINEEIKQLIKEGNTLEQALYLNFNGRLIAPGETQNYVRYGITLSSPLIGSFIILCYAAFCWYREWFGSNKTIYSLIMLPVSKSVIILSKLVSVVIYFCVLIGTQFIAEFINYKVFYAILPKDGVLNVNFLEVVNRGNLSIIFGEFLNPIELILFLTSVILIIFTAVFIERFIKGKGLILSIIYGCIYIALYTYVPFEMLTLFAGEKLLYFIIVPSISIISNFYLSKYLFENKVSV
ncbi:hypothetical protein [Clostridium ihumii]|uniref:hypothetical protein n=1 Tax=Clostridium ihumii TaxID=1470356 RepID=UPI00058B6F1A|nr:hypothetical protein [Clostridium ihumii]